MIKLFLAAIDQEEALQSAANLQSQALASSGNTKAIKEQIRKLTT